MCDDLDQAVVADSLNVLNDKINLTPGKGIIFPLIDEGFVKFPERYDIPGI